MVTFTNFHSHDYRLLPHTMQRSRCKFFHVLPNAYTCNVGCLLGLQLSMLCDPGFIYIQYANASVEMTFSKQKMIVCLILYFIGFESQLGIDLIKYENITSLFVLHGI